MTAALALAANQGGSRPAKLVMLQAPISGNQSAVVPIPILEIQDASGRRVHNSEMEVKVEAVGDSATVVGSSTVTTVEGRATFNRIALGLAAPAGTQLRFSAKGLEPVTVVLDSPGGATLWLDRANLNGQMLQSEHRQLTVHPGELIQGEVRLRYSAYWPAASVILGAFPSWGDKRKSFVTVSALATPIVDAVSRHELSIPGPDTPGDYHLVLSFAAETDARWIASGTNWAVGAPVWDDGNDLADLTASDVAEANATGQLSRPWLFQQSRAFISEAVATTVIEVRVR